MAGPADTTYGNPSTSQPQAMPTQLLTMTKAQLDSLVQSIATATVKAADDRTAPPPQRPSTTKDLKIAEPSPFTGKPEDLEPLLRECEIRFDIQNDIYNDAARKAYFVLSLFKSGTAKTWKEQYIRSREGHSLVMNDDWDAFKRLLKSGFPEVGRTQDAMQALSKIRQGKMTVDELNANFRLLIQKAGLDIARNADVLIQWYENAINRNIAQQIILSGTPNNLDNWMQKASELDSAYKRANRLFASAITKGSKQNFRPRFNAPTISSKNHDMGEPMDIDRLQPQEVERRKKKNLCFECGKEGHYASDHRNGKLPPVNPGNSNGGPPPIKRPTFQGQKLQGKKGKAPQRKMNSSQLRQHIRALIDENFEEESQEYDEFIQEIEEKGF